MSWTTSTVAVDRPTALTTRVVVAGEVDIASAGSLRAAIGSAMGGRMTVVVVDVSKVTFIDCAGLGELVVARARLLASGRSMRLFAPSPVVRRLMALTGLSDGFEVVPALVPAA